MIDSEIERAIIRLVEDHLPEKERAVAREWLHVRVEAFKALKRLN